MAKKIRFYFIWEQDETYQKYIRPHWGKYGIPTIISDQFIALFYHWKKYVPADQQAYLVGSWMKANILENHGPLCSLYKAHMKGDKGFGEGDFRSEGDSPAFIYNIPNGLRSDESPDWGGWGGRFVKVRENTWLDPVFEPGYEYPEGRWFTNSAWGRQRLKKEIANDAELIAYLKPQWRWIDALQNDFAARADWCVKDFEEANHAPVVKVNGELMRDVKPGETVKLAATATDPDGDKLTVPVVAVFRSGFSHGDRHHRGSDSANEASFIVPREPGKQVHIVLEVTDDGTPPLKSYQRVICNIKRTEMKRAKFTHPKEMTNMLSRTTLQFLALTLTTLTATDTFAEEQARINATEVRLLTGCVGWGALPGDRLDRYWRHRSR